MFRTGERVVCVDNDWRVDDATLMPPSVPKIGSVYTIRNVVRDDARGWAWVRVQEIVLPPGHIYGHGFVEPAFMSCHFRPVIETDISIFTAMLAPKKERVDA